MEEKLRRDLPIVTTPHAHSHLTNKGDESFTNVHAVDFWETLPINITPPSSAANEHSGKPHIQVTGMPGTHVPPGPLAIANDILSAVPPTNGWMLELGYLATSDPDSFTCGYRIYITGDTLLFSDLHRIPELYCQRTSKPIDLMLIHLGGTTIPGPSMPLLMVTMDARQGVQLMQIINADITIPIHYDDYDVFLSGLGDFQKEVAEKLAGKEEWKDRVVYLDRGEEYRFQVRDEGSSASGAEAEAGGEKQDGAPGVASEQSDELPIKPEAIKALYPGGGQT